MNNESPARQLGLLLQQPGLITMPCCYDALSALLIERAGFPLTFMSGFAVSASRLGLPDTGLISYGEMLDQGRDICSAVSIPVIGDADTGYGNPMNVRRTVRGYARAGLACAMIEDQEIPKRCGHTRGKRVVARSEAVSRVRAAVDERDSGVDIMIMARTDALYQHGLEEALWRCHAFMDLGADIIFLEAPLNPDQMEQFCKQISAPKMVNMLEQGDTPLLPISDLEQMGYKIAAYPLTLLSAASRAISDALDQLAHQQPVEAILDFTELRKIVGFESYDRALDRYKTEQQ